MPRTLLSAFVALAAALPALAADEAYTLKLYKEKEGDVLKKTKVTKTDGSVVVAIAGTNQDEKQKGGENVVFTEEVLKTDGKRATKFQRTYEKVEKTDNKGEEVKSALVGKTVVITREKDKATYTVDGKAATAEQAKELDAEFGEKKSDFDKHDMLPDKAVKVGDTWKLDKKKVLDAMGEMKGVVLDEDKSSFTGKLVKAEKKDGVLRGTLEFNLKFAITDFPLGPNMAVPTEAGSEMVIKATIETCLDGTVPGEKSDMSMTMAIKAKLPMDGKLELNTTVTGTETEEPAKKK